MNLKHAIMKRFFARGVMILPCAGGIKTTGNISESDRQFLTNNISAIRTALTSERWWESDRRVCF